MEIKLYSADYCSYCTKVKNLLNENGLKYIEIDINTDPEAKPWIKSQGFRTIPIAIIDGEVLPDSELIMQKIKNQVA